ncbi:unnamed protein product [Protopolystoma xenopodis]|uniref:hydroxymethylbilane synthase n=1 Tax=Protopolystoma xenopodis TaxID=117903 RepID=A0A448WD48_9PLAT|nr:unnamed protein product [Protopolystoma xenopodis]
MHASTHTYKVGTRASQLAVVQTSIVVDLLKAKNPNANFKLIKIKTIGDKILDVALSKIGEKSLFTKELESALLSHEVDFVVHSLKDVPTSLPAGLVLGCVCERLSPCDVVLMSPSNRGEKLSTLPKGSVVGTGSLRRVSLLSQKFPDLNFASIRGNLVTRLSKLDGNTDNAHSLQSNDTRYDALVLAKAGIERLGWEDRIDEILEDMLYAVGQGALTCECRYDDNDSLRLLSTIHNEAAALGVIAERALMRGLDGGCSTPIGVRSYLDPNGFIHPHFLKLEGAVLNLDGTRCVFDQMVSNLPSIPPDTFLLKYNQRSSFKGEKVIKPKSDEAFDIANRNSNINQIKQRQLKRGLSGAITSVTVRHLPRVRSHSTSSLGLLPQDSWQDDSILAFPRGNMWITESPSPIPQPYDEFTFPIKRKRRESSSCDISSAATRLSQKLQIEQPESEDLKLALDPDTVILGFCIRPICSTGRLRMVCAQRLGQRLAKRLLSLGADAILEEIRHGSKIPPQPVSDHIRIILFSFLTYFTVWIIFLFNLFVFDFSLLRKLRLNGINLNLTSPFFAFTSHQLAVKLV